MTQTKQKKLTEDPAIQILSMARRRAARIFVISSPSGGGKTTVVDQLLRQMPRLMRSVSITTRPPRMGERSGFDYQFVSPRTFQNLKRTDQLLEWAKVHGSYYGTPKRPVMRAIARRQHVILNIDVQGARKIRRTMGKDAVLIFLLPPSMTHLKQRLMRRRTETAEIIRQRLAVARAELAHAATYDYVVVNDRVPDAVAQLEAIVTAEALSNQR